MGENDADKRPSVYGKTQTRDATIEVSVTGAEGEGTEDLTDVFDHALDRIVSESNAEDDEIGVE